MISICNLHDTSGVLVLAAPRFNESKLFVLDYAPTPSTMAAKSPEVIADKSEMRSWSHSKRSQSKTLALVPTMGFLHKGHLSLIHLAKTLADLTVVSIYVNPGQFSPSEDLSTYPTDLAGDLEKLAQIGVDAVFCPKNLYYYGAGGRVLKPQGGGGEMGVSCVASEDDGGEEGLSAVEDHL